MFIDMVLVVPIVFGGMLGFRDGAVRKFVAIIAAIGALFLAHALTPDLGKLLIENLNVDPAWAPIHAYLIIFLSLVTLVSLLYKVLTDNYKIGGLADRVAGTFFGMLHTAFVLSVILMMFSLKGIPSKSASSESRSYKSILGIAPQMIDMLTTQLPEVKDALHSVTRPELRPLDEIEGIKEKVQDMMEESVEKQTEEQMQKMPSAADSVKKSPQN
jgi:membrane protein required for colicin V production